ncbi:MAG: HAMP domain-containing sensor histidine kinase [bacterium]|nr:HAMP domain-containing sensor histidine kinase [bacterium]
MKKDRNFYFVVLSGLALVALLVIQVLWLMKTALVKEELFNEKANMVLSRTTQELCADKKTCEKMNAYCVEESNKDCRLALGKTEAKKIDSLLNFYMGFYNFHLDYTYEVIQHGQHAGKHKRSNQAGNVYKKRIEEIAYRSGLELKLIFPEKKAFIIEEMGLIFLSSILLIVVVFLLFLQTVRTLIKEKKLAARTTDFLNNMTHEFKTPLTNIGLASKMMVKETNIGVEEKVKHYAGIIKTENEKLRAGVEQVLSITALEREEFPFQKEDIDLNSLINNAVTCISVQTENENGTIDCNLRAADAMVFGDKAHLNNVVCNLLDNAIKYSKESLSIVVETYAENGAIVCKISDRGTGIEKAYLAHVFDKYYRVPTGNLHDVKGFGLGLSYVKKIIELHGGTVGITSELGAGTTILFKLPLKNA